MLRQEGVMKSSGWQTYSRLCVLIWEEKHKNKKVGKRSLKIGKWKTTRLKNHQKWGKQKKN